MGFLGFGLICDVLRILGTAATIGKSRVNYREHQPSYPPIKPTKKNYLGS